MGPKASRANAPAAISDYTFRQRFRVPPSKALAWCLEFTAKDLAHPPENAVRKVTWVGPRTVVLDDRFLRSNGRRARKVKLVQIYPDTRSWVSTHILGPNHHSQFRYRVVPDGLSGSALVFEGRDIGWEGPRLSAADSRKRARILRTEDANLWKRFAFEMEQDVTGH